MSFPPHPNVNTFRPLHLIVIRLKEVYEVLYDFVLCMGEGILYFFSILSKVRASITKMRLLSKQPFRILQVKKFYMWFAYSAS